MKMQQLRYFRYRAISMNDRIWIYGHPTDAMGNHVVFGKYDGAGHDWYTHEVEPKSLGFQLPLFANEYMLHASIPYKGKLTQGSDIIMVTRGGIKTTKHIIAWKGDDEFCFDLIPSLYPHTNSLQKLKEMVGSGIKVETKIVGNLWQTPEKAPDLTEIGGIER